MGVVHCHVWLHEVQKPSKLGFYYRIYLISKQPERRNPPQSQLLLTALVWGKRTGTKRHWGGLYIGNLYLKAAKPSGYVSKPWRASCHPKMARMHVHALGYVPISIQTSPIVSSFENHPRLSPSPVPLTMLRYRLSRRTWNRCCAGCWSLRAPVTSAVLNKWV